MKAKRIEMEVKGSSPKELETKAMKAAVKFWGLDSHYSFGWTDDKLVEVLDYVAKPESQDTDGNVLNWYADLTVIPKI